MSTNVTTSQGCPACHGKLFAAPDRVGVLGCNACGGIWADIETSQLVAAVLDPDLVDVANRAADNAARSTKGAPVAAHDVRHCPVCGERLERVHTASTNLDVCIMHGTWFDRGELQRVSRKLDAERAPAWGAAERPRGESHAAPVVDPGAMAADIGGGVAAEAGFMAIRTLLNAAAGARR